MKGNYGGLGPNCQHIELRAAAAVGAAAFTTATPAEDACDENDSAICSALESSVCMHAAGVEHGGACHLRARCQHDVTGRQRRPRQHRRRQIRKCEKGELGERRDDCGGLLSWQRWARHVTCSWRSASKRADEDWQFMGRLTVFKWRLTSASEDAMNA